MSSLSHQTDTRAATSAAAAASSHSGSALARARASVSVCVFDIGLMGGTCAHHTHAAAAAASSSSAASVYVVSRLVSVCRSAKCAIMPPPYRLLRTSPYLPTNTNVTQQPAGTTPRAKRKTIPTTPISIHTCRPVSMVRDTRAVSLHISRSLSLLASKRALLLLSLCGESRMEGEVVRVVVRVSSNCARRPLALRCVWRFDALGARRCRRRCRLSPAAARHRHKAIFIPTACPHYTCRSSI